MQTVIDILLGSLALLFAVATALPLIRHDQWWIRIFDFPRAQIAVCGLAVLAFCLYRWDLQQAEYVVPVALLAVSIVYQGTRIYPYTPVAGRQVKRAGKRPTEGTVSLLIANVLMTNRRSDGFIDLVKIHDPDIILTVETDAWWAEQLQVLEADHPYTVKCALGNTYGMLMYSRLPLIDPEVQFLVQDDIPSIHTGIVLQGGRRIQFRGIHPRPPYPKEAMETTPRDAELLLVGQEVKDLDEPVIVAGDLNDVAWSYTTHLFQKISSLLDPRRGRGMYNTFHAQNPLMRWPLDHVFHSDDFMLVELERLPAFGSDHFAVFVKLSLEAGAALVQEEPQADEDEQEQAEEKIEKAHDAG